MNQTSPEPLFFTLAIAATIGYSFQSTLMASFYRSIDRLSAVAYRGLTLGITMLPLLAFVPRESYQQINSLLPAIALASLLAALGNWCAANAFHYLPIGIASALSMSFATLVTILIAHLFLGEALSSIQLLLIAMILCTVIGLGITKSAHLVLPTRNPRKGLFYSLLFGVFLGSAYSVVGESSRRFHPLLVAYLWEFGIGIIAAIVCFARKKTGGSGLQALPVKRLITLALFSSPTAVGTGAYATATTLGPLGIATAIIGTMMVCNTILARILYHERLVLKQWTLLLVACAFLALLRLVSA